MQRMLKYACVLAQLCLLPAPIFSEPVRHLKTLEHLESIHSDHRVHVVLVLDSSGERGSKKDKKLDPDHQLYKHIAEKYPAFAEVAVKLYKSINFNAVDLHKTSKAIKKEIKKWSLPTHPALLLFKDEPKMNPYTNKLYRDKEILSATELLTSSSLFTKRLHNSVSNTRVVDLKSEKYPLNALTNAFESGNKTVILFTESKQSPLAYRAISLDMVDQDMIFYHYYQKKSKSEDADKDELLDAFQIEKLPALVIAESLTKFKKWKEASSSTIKLHDDLTEFIGKFDTAEEKNKPKKKVKPVPKKTEPIEVFNATTVEESLSDAHVVWVMSFSTDEDVQYWTENANEWQKIEKQMYRKYGIISVGLVNCDKEEPSFCEKYGGKGVYRVFPLTLKEDAKRGMVLHRDRGDNLMLPYIFSTLEEAQEAAIASIPHVVDIMTSDVEISKFIVHTHEDKGVPVILFTNKNEIPALFKAVSVSYPGHGMKFGMVVNADKEVRTKFSVPERSSTWLACYVNKANEKEADSAQETVVLPYDRNSMGSYNFLNLARYLMQILSKYGPRPNPEDFETGESDELAKKPAHNLIPYMTKDNQKKLCGSGKICVIGFFEDHVDTLSDADSPLNARLNVLKEVMISSKKKKEPYVFMWTNGKCQNTFAETFGVGQYQMPTIIVYSPSKDRFALAVGVFDFDNLKTFLQNILIGKIGTAPVDREVPELGEECAKDAEQNDISEEEDENLDEIMDEIIQAEKEQKRVLEEEQKKSKKRKKGKKGKKKRGKRSSDEL